MPTRNGFQNFVNQQPAPAVAGDFASANLRASLNGSVPEVAAPNAVTLGYRVAPGQIVIVGNFAWADPATGLVYGEETANCRVAFVHREQGQTIITEFKGYERDAIQEGFPVALMVKGDFWAQFPADLAVAVDAPVYADATDGSPTTVSGGNVATGFTAKSVTLADAEVTADMDATQSKTGLLDVTAVASGVLSVGQFISGANIPVSANAMITGQVSGTEGGVGVYQTTYAPGAVVASATVNATDGKLAKISTW